MTAIELEDAPAIGNLRFRLFRDADDYAHIASIENAFNAAHGLPFQMSSEELVNDMMTDDTFDLRRDVLIAEVNGEPAGFARLYHFVNDEGDQIFAHACCELPALTETGLHRALLQWAERRAGEIARAVPHTGPRFMQAYVMEKAPAHITILEQLGYSIVRYSYLMVRPLDESIPDLPLPAGIEVRPKQREHYRALWEARNEAFRDHWGYRKQTEDDWRRYLDWPDHQPELCQVAWDTTTNEVAGEVNVTIIRRDNETFGTQRGWTDPIFVRRPWRKQGLAKALIVRAMRVLKDAGMAEAALGVDVQNPNGALRLYEGLGYRVDTRSFTFRKAI